MASVTIRKLSKRFGDSVAIDNVDLDVHDGEFLTFLGPSGCGKTTTLRCIAGLERPTGGEITIGDDVVVGNGRSVPPNHRNLGMVFQSYALWPHLTVEKNVRYPLQVRGRGDGRNRRVQVAEALERVGLSHMAKRSVGSLSGGQQQRVSLARAIVAQPPLLLFDEPLSNLDAKLRGTMRAELQGLHEKLGTTSIYVTHDRIEALTLSDRIVVMKDGAVRQVGTPEEIYSSPTDRFVADFIGFENFLPATVLSQHDAEVVVEVPGSGRLRGRASSSLQPGDPVVVAVRSSALSLTADETELDNTLPMQVVSRTYFGDHYEYIVDVGGHDVKVQLPLAVAAALHGGADAARLVLPASELNVFPE